MLVLFLYDFCSTVEIKTIQNENRQTMNSKRARQLPPSLAFGRFKQEWARFMVKKEKTLVMLLGDCWCGEAEMG